MIFSGTKEKYLYQAVSWKDAHNFFMEPCILK